MGYAFDCSMATSGRKIQSVFNVHLERLARGVSENIKKKTNLDGTFTTQPFILHLKLYLCLSLFSQKELLSIHKFPEFSIFLYNIVIKNADVPVQGKNSTSLSDCLSVFHLKKHSLILDTNSVQKFLSFPSIWGSWHFRCVHHCWFFSRTGNWYFQNSVILSLRNRDEPVCQYLKITFSPRVWKDWAWCIMIKIPENGGLKLHMPPRYSHVCLCFG